MKPPPDSYLRMFNERVFQHIHEQNVKKFLAKEMGDGEDNGRQDYP